jgi:beta-phosphoglucomutase
MKVGLLFDNDGVLIDSSEFHWQSWKLLMQEINHEFMTKEQFILGFGKRNDLILNELLPEFSSHEKRELALKKEALFRKCAAGRVMLLPGMEEFLKEVQKAEIPKIIASSTPPENLEMFITSTVLGNYFNAYVSAEDVAHGKPFPDVFLEAARRLGMDATQCIVLEDSPAGIEAGLRAGCFVVALETSHKKEQLRDYHLCFPDSGSLKLSLILQAFDQWKEKDRNSEFS